MRNAPAITPAPTLKKERSRLQENTGAGIHRRPAGHAEPRHVPDRAPERSGHRADQPHGQTQKEEVAGSFEKSPVKILGKAIDAANSHIRQKAMEKEELRGMGTTVVAATCLKEKYLEVANVGDSRLYVVNDSKIEQITRDHSLVAALSI